MACVSSGTHQQVVTERDALRADKARLEQRVSRLEATSESLDSERVALIDQMEDLNQQQQQLEKDLRRLRKAEAQLSKSLAEREAQLASSTEEVERLRGTYEGLVADLEAELAQGQIEIQQLREGLQLNMAQEVLFASGSAKVNTTGRVLLAKVAERVRGVPYRVVVQGHTDNVPLRNTKRFADNWELAGARSSHVVRLLQANGVPPERLSAVSFGEHAPRDSNDTPKGRARNRRIEITLKPLDGSAVASLPGDAKKSPGSSRGGSQAVPAAAAR
ncbi:MAG: OmpA family protein [Myxococcota bacterium]|nr:OmpA family protein [Myxococcota bacterium]